jgi:hypothetical protein
MERPGRHFSPEERDGAVQVSAAADLEAAADLGAEDLAAAGAEAGGDAARAKATKRLELAGAGRAARASRRRRRRIPVNRPLKCSPSWIAMVTACFKRTKRAAFEIRWSKLTLTGME